MTPRTVTSLQELAGVLALLPDDAQITVTVSVKDLARSLEQRSDHGPENVDTKQAATLLGYSPERWRRWAEARVIAGAWQDVEGGSWHLPLSACEAHIRDLQRRGKSATVHVDSSSRSVPRGPRSRTKRPARRSSDVLSIEEAQRATGA